MRNSHCARAKSVLSSKDAYHENFAHNIDFQQQTAVEVADSKQGVTVEVHLEGPNLVLRLDPR